MAVLGSRRRDLDAAVPLARGRDRAMR